MYSNKLNIKKPQDYLKILFDKEDKFYVCTLGGRAVSYETDINSMEKFQYGLRDRNQPHLKYIQELKELEEKHSKTPSNELETKIKEIKEILSLPKKNIDNLKKYKLAFGEEVNDMLKEFDKLNQKSFGRKSFDELFGDLIKETKIEELKSNPHNFKDFIEDNYKENKYLKRDNIQYSVSSFEIENEEDRIKEIEDKFNEYQKISYENLSPTQRNEYKTLKKYFKYVKESDNKVDMIKFKNYGRKKENVKEIKCLFFDFDEPHMVERQEKKLFEMLGEPTAVVESSPGKRQIVYKLEKGVPFEKSEDFEKLMYLFNVKVEGDPAVRTTQQILRLPFYENVKSKYKREDGSFPKSQLLGTSNSKLNFETLWNKYKVEAEEHYEEYLKNKNTVVNANYPSDYDVVDKYKQIKNYGKFLSIYKRKLLGKKEISDERLHKLFPDKKMSDLSKEEFQTLVKSMGKSYRKTDWYYSIDRAKQTDDFLLVWNEIKSFRKNLGNEFDITDNINNPVAIKNQFDMCFNQFISQRLEFGLSIDKTVEGIYPERKEEIVQSLIKNYEDNKRLEEEPSTIKKIQTKLENNNLNTNNSNIEYEEEYENSYGLRN